MNLPAIATALAAALAISTAAAESPPLNVLGPYSTPEDASVGVPVPDPASDAGREHSEYAVERSSAATPDSNPGLGLGVDPLAGGGGNQDAGWLDSGQPGKAEKPGKGDDKDDDDKKGKGKGKGHG